MPPRRAPYPLQRSRRNRNVNDLISAALAVSNDTIPDPHTYLCDNTMTNRTGQSLPHTTRAINRYLNTCTVQDINTILSNSIIRHCGDQEISFQPLNSNVLLREPLRFCEDIAIFTIPISSNILTRVLRGEGNLLTILDKALDHCESARLKTTRNLCIALKRRPFTIMQIAIDLESLLRIF